MKAFKDIIVIFLIGVFPILSFGQDSLFKSTDVPGSTFSENPLEVGTLFTTAIAGEITRIKFYATAAGNYPFTLWRGQNRIYQDTITATRAGWAFKDVSVPVGAESLMASVYAYNGRYGSRNNVFGAIRTAGNISAPVGAGKYVYASASLYPTESYRNCSYYVDIVFSEKVVPIVISAGTDTTLTLSLDTTGSVPYVNYTLKGTGPTNLKYSWSEVGVDSIQSDGLEFPRTFHYEGGHIYTLTAKNSAGNVVAVKDVIVMVQGNPKDVIIELLRDGTYRVKDKVILIKEPWGVEKPIRP